MWDEFDTVRTGEKWAMADPGRAGRFLDAAAFFWAITSRKLGLADDDDMVLLDKPSPGRTVPSAFLGEFGLFESFCNSFCAVASSPFMIASALAGHMLAKVQ